MKAYSVVFNGRFASRAALQAFLDQRSEIPYWYSCLPNCTFVFTDLSAHEVAKLLDDEFGTGKGMLFLVSEVGRNRQGRLPRKLWEVLRNPAQAEHNH